MAETRHGTLAANTATTVSLSGNYDELQLLNRDGTAEIYYTIDGSAPTVGGNDCLVLPATVGWARIPSQSRAGTTVRMIANAPVRYSIRPLDPFGSTSASLAPPLTDQIPGSALWLAADKLTGLSDGASVAAWSDASGNGRTLTQATGGSQPTWRAAGLNGNPSVRFDGVDDYLEIPYAADLNTSSYTIALVLNPTGGAGAYRSPLTSRDTSNARGYIFYASIGDQWSEWNGNSTATFSFKTAGVATLNQPVVLVGTCDGFNGVELRRNGSILFSAPMSALPYAVNTARPLRVGAGSTEGAASFFWNGDIAEVVIFSRALTTAERAQLEQYLGKKYAITITPAFRPPDVPNLAAWYSADQLNSVANTTAVVTWTDSSGNARNATQATGGFQPTYRTNVFNGWPVVRFDGVDDRLVTANFTATQPNTVIVVGQLTSLPATNRYFFDAGTRQAVYSRNSGEWSMYAGTTLSGPISPDTNRHVFVATFNGASSQLRRDGHVEATGNAGAASINNIILGCDFTGTLFGPMDIAEVIVYNRILTATEIAQLEAYCATRYAIALG